MAGMAHRDRLLAAGVDAAARGVFERLFGLVAEVIVTETVKRGTEREWIGERASVSRGADTKANTTGWRRTAASAEAPLTPMLLTLTLRVRGGARMVREQPCLG